MLIATVPYVGKRLHLDPDPNMQIISDPAGSGSTTLPKRQLLVLYTVSALMYLINIGLVGSKKMDLQHIMCFCPKNFAKPSSPSIKIIF
jgi:hypothetical protein